MKISVITPSIRPDGLKTTFETLSKQTLPREDWEWLPRLSIPGERPDLCKQVNRAIAESQGELIVFLQDYISIKPDALERCWETYKKNERICHTMPVGKDHGQIDWDWRYYWKKDEITFERWEIDFGMCPSAAIKDIGFFERYDEGFGWENVDTAYILSKTGYSFGVDTENEAIAIDHDAFIEHPYRKNSNMHLWQKRREVIDEIYSKQYE